MDKTQFVRAMNDFEKLFRKSEKQMRVLQDCGIGIEHWIVFEFIDAHVTLLEDAVGDKEVDRSFGSNIAWWVYETDFGNNDVTRVITYDDGERKVIDSAEALYDLIAEFKSEEV